MVGHVVIHATTHHRPTQCLHKHQKKKQYRKRENLTTGEELAAAAVTGGIVGLVTNPLDLVKTRLMTGVSAWVGG